MKQLNGLNSIHSAVPQSVTQIEAVTASVTDLAHVSADSPDTKDGRQDTKKISGLKPI